MSRSKKTRAERAADLLSFYSKKELADSMGVTTQTVNNWIKGKTQPSDSNFKKISRREYYWTGGERARTVKDSKTNKGETVETKSFELFDLIRQVETGNFDVSKFDGNKFIDFNSVIIDQRGTKNERLFTFVNPNEGAVNENDVIGFLYRTFRENIDRFGGSEIGLFVENIEV